MHHTLSRVVWAAVVSAPLLLLPLATFGASSLFDDAMTVSVGNPADAVQIRSDATVAPGFGGISFDDANGTLFSSLSTLSTDFNVTDDNCGAGSPRIQIRIDSNDSNVNDAGDGNIFVYLGPSPSFTGCAQNTWLSSGNLVGNNDAGRWDSAQIPGGTNSGTYTQALAAAGPHKILRISIVDDSSWSAAATGGDGEMTTLLDNVTINSTTYTFPPPPPVTVTIHKYVDGVHADATNAEGQSFPMQSCWDAVNLGGPGCGVFSLTPTTYDAQTSSMTSGADYSTNEDLTGPSVGASCAEGKPFALVGYSTGDTETLAASSTVSTTSPAFTNIVTDKHVIVWNRDCTPKLTLNKIVINDSVGIQQESAWTLTATGFTSLSGPGTSGSNDVESNSSFQAGSYDLSETGPTGYTASAWSCQGGAMSDADTVVVAPGESVICTIINNDNPQAADACSTPTQAPAGYTLQNGTSGADNVILSPNTMFVGKGGNDRVSAGDGNYIICTGGGNDFVTVGNGNWTVGAGGGNNIVRTGNGDGTIKTGGGNDVITTGDGIHVVTSGAGNDSVTTGNGSDSITTGSGNDVVRSGGGDDSVSSGAGNDFINGEAGTDTCNGGTGINAVIDCEL